MLYIFCINLESILKRKDITLPRKFHIVKAIVFLVVMYGSESWIIKKTEIWRIYAFELQQYVNWEIPDVQVGFRKGRGTRDQIANIHWVIKRARKFQENIYFCFIDYAKAFECVDHNKLWTIFQEMGIPDHLTCLLRNLYVGQEATVRTGRGTTGKEYVKVPNGKRSTSRLYIVTLLI